jgi:hypothetical protein
MFKRYRQTKDWDTLAAAYKTLLEQRAVESTIDPATFEGACLLCSEHEPSRCHRRLTLGTVRSIGRTFTIVFSSGGPVFSALAFDLRGSYEVAFLVFVGTYTAAALLVLATPIPRHPDGGTPVGPAGAIPSRSSEVIATARSVSSAS